MARLHLLCAFLMSCASPPDTSAESDTYGFAKDGWVWVRGPWNEIKPSRDVDDVIDQLCPAIMRLSLAGERDYGQEYCGDLYTVGDDQLYYASTPSPLGDTRVVGPSKQKSCLPPKHVIDPRGVVSVHGDFHSHPWSRSPMSDRDMRTSTQLWSVRIQFDTKCRVMKLIPHLNEDRPGEVYERQGKSWKRVGIIKPADKAYGIVTAVDE